MSMFVLLTLPTISFSYSASRYFVPTTPTANAATVISTNGFLASWSNESAVSYRIDVSTNPSFSSFVGVYNDYTVAGTSTTVSGLVAGQTYYYRVRSFDGVLYSGFSATISTTTVTEPPLIISPTFITTTTSRINWQISNGAISYLLDVANDAFYTSMVLTNQSTANTYYNLSGLTAGNTYYYRVRAVTAGGNSTYSTNESFTTVPSAPAASSASSVGTTGFTANWNPVNGATGYRVDVSLYSSFSSFLAGYADQTAATNNLSVAGLVEGQTYHYRVRAVTSGGSSTNSNTITTTTLPVAPVALSATSVTGTSFTANWNYVNGAAEYRIDVANNPGFSPILTSYNDLQVLSNSFSVTGLSSTVTYYYRVRAVSAGGSSTNSNPIQVLGTPTTSAASGATENSFQANWSTVTGATSYLIDVALDNGFTNILPSYNNLSTTNTSQVINSLASGETYYYRVRAVSGATTSFNSNISSIATVPQRPNILAPTAINSDRFTANWSGSFGAISYRVDVDQNGSFAAPIVSDVIETGTSVTITGLTAGQTYFYRVQAVSSGGASVESSSISLVTTPGAPTVLAGSNNTASSFLANWASVTGASSYLLYVSANSSFSSHLVGYNGFATTATNAIISSLSPGTTYYYRVKAVNGGGNSGFSSDMSAMTWSPAPALAATSSVASTGFTINWNNSAGAANYYVDVATDNLFSSLVSGYSNVSTVSTSLPVTGLSAGTNYYYRVRAENAGGTGPNSSVGNIATITNLPTVIAASSILNNGFTANWQATTGATSYQLDVSLNNSFSPNLPGFNNLSVTGTSYSVAGLASGQTYYYRIRAVNSGGVSSNSNVISTITIAGTPATIAASAVSVNSFMANWNPVTGASNYLIDVATDAGFATILPSYNGFSVAATSLSISSLSEGTTYYYRVRASNASGVSGNSNTTTAVTIPPAPIVNPATGVTSTSFTANWSATSGASDYKLDVSSDPAFSSFVGVYNNFSVAGTSATVSSLATGTTYYYRVRANNINGASSSSSVVTVITIPNSPVATSASFINGTSFNANWNTVSGAVDFRLDVSTNSSFSSFVSGFNDKIVNGLTEPVTGLSSFQTYYYRVRSVNSSGLSGYSNIIIVPGAPISLSGSLRSTTGFTANWNAVTDATGYKIDVSDQSDFSSLISGYNNQAVSGTSLSITGLTSGVNYFYRIRALGSGGTSVNSDVISVTTLSEAPVALAASNTTNNSFDANWTSSGGASNYRLDVSTDNAFTSILSAYNNISVIGTTWAVGGLTSGQAYYYRVRAENAGGLSSNSNTVSITTIPIAPVAANSSSRNASGFTANWGAVAGALNYELDVASDNMFSNIVPGYNDLAVSGTPYNVTGLNSGVTYYYRVRAVSSGGVSPNSEAIEATTLPLAPSASTATSISTSGFTANWNAAGGATNYYLDVATNNTFTTLLPGYNNVSINALSYNVSGLTEGSTYYYRVRAENSGGIGDNSSTIAVTTIPSAPVANAGSGSTANSFVANWSEAAGATSYRLDVATDNLFSNILASYNGIVVTGTSTTVSGLTTGLPYYYRLRAFTTGGVSISSNTIEVYTISPAPVILAASSITATSFTSNWTASAGASSYRIDISTNSGFSAILPAYNNITVSGTSFLASGLNEGTQYFYRVRAVNAGGISSNSVPQNIITIPKAPVASAATAITVNSFRSNWTTVSGAASYRIDVSLDPLFNSFVSGYNNRTVTGGTTSFLNITSLEAGQTYYYRLRAVGASGTSGNSNIISVTTVPAVPDGVHAVDNATTSFLMKWDAAFGATGYKVDVSTSSGFATFVGAYNNYDVTTNSLLISGLTPGTAYYFQVRAYTSGGVSANIASPVLTYTVPVAPVAAMASSISVSSFTANWSSVSGAFNYSLDVSTQPDFSVPVAGYDNLILPSSPLSKTVSGLSSGFTYYYRIRGVNPGGQGANSNVIIVPGAPVGKAPTSISENSFVANWNPVPGATSYRLEVFILPGGATRLSGYEDLSVSGTSQLVTGLTAGTSYSYVVRAVSSGGTGNYSNEIIVPAAPVAAPASSVTQNSFIANWGPVNGATEYRVDVSKLPGFEEFESVYNNYFVNFSSLNTLIDSDIDPGLTYYYRIRAVSSGGAGINSNVISLVTIPAAPTAVNASNVSTTSFRANWNSSIGASSYRLDVSTSSTFSGFVGIYNNYPVSGTSVLISGLTEGETYYYRLKAVNSGGVSSSSNSIAVRTGTVTITAPSLNALCTNGDYVSLGDIIIEEGSNDVFTPKLDSVTVVFSVPTGFELKEGVGSAVKIRGSDLAVGIVAKITTSHITVKYLVQTAGGIEDAFKITGLKVRAVGSASSGKILRTGGDAEQAGNYVSDGLAFGYLSSSNTTSASIVGLASSYCVNGGPVSLIGSPADNDGSGGVTGIFSGRGIVNNVFYPGTAGTGFDTLYYTYTNLSGCTFTYSQIIFVNPLPTVDFYLNNNDTSVCASVASVPLNGTPNGGVFVGPNVGQNSSGGYIFFASQANTGPNEISYRYTTSENCEVLVTKNIYVNPAPKAGFQLSDFCDGKTINFTDTSRVSSGEITAWEWNFGDGTVIDTAQHIQNPSHVYSFDGVYTVTLKVWTGSNPTCESTASAQVIIGKTPKPSFTWESSCLGDFTKFYDATGIDESVTERTWDFADGTTSDAASPEHIFPAPGVYKVKLTIKTNANCTESSTIEVPVFPYVNSFPYSQSFEDSNNGWVKGGVNSSWILKAPNGSVINKAFSGTMAWVTDNNGTYNNNEKSFIEGPCFNLQDLSKPMVSFKIWIDSDQGADGAVLQITSDNGKTWEVVGELNKGLGWYNTSPIIGAPGGQQIMGWSGRVANTKWRDAKFYLDKYKSASSVRFRISFGSSSENPLNENFNGIAIDDFWIGERTHNVLVEHFMNNERGMAEAHVISKFVELENEELIDIHYHTDFPQVDSVNLRNSIDPSARALFYGIQEVPATVMDGAYKVNSITENDTTKYKSYVLKEARFKINISVDETSGPNEVPIRTTVEAVASLSAPVIIFCAIVQKYMHGDHPMRFLTKMLPDAAGISINKTWQKGDKEASELVWYPENLISDEEVGVIVFVQNRLTKEIYQSVYKEINIDPSKVTGIDDERTANEGFKLFPNPVLDKSTLSLPHTYVNDINYHIYDALGKQVLKGMIESGQIKTVVDSKALAGGLYTIHVYENKRLLWMKKLIIAH